MACGRMQCMTSEGSARKPRFRVPKTVWDLIFTLIIPILILTPNILGEGIGVASMLGEGETGNIRAYLLAALIPVAYVAWDLLINRNVSPVALIGGAGAICTGALAFWYVDGFWYAIKDSARQYLIGIAFLVSAMTRIPLFKVFLDAGSMGESEENRQVMQKAMNDPAVHRGLALGTAAFAVVDIIGGVVNSVVNYQHVVAKFGTEDFNAQIAQVNAMMRIPGLIIGLVGVGVAIYLVQQAVKKRFGSEASIMEPAKLAEAVNSSAG